jgi:hypothetical protein
LIAFASTTAHRNVRKDIAMTGERYRHDRRDHPVWAREGLPIAKRSPPRPALPSTPPVRLFQHFRIYLSGFIAPPGSDWSKMKVIFFAEERRNFPDQGEMIDYAYRPTT